MIRFWDTSALVKVCAASEVGHREAVRLLSGPRARKVRHATSMLVAVELVSVIARRVGDAGLIGRVLRQLEFFSQAELTARHRNLGTRLARLATTRGADTAIAAQALIVAESAPDGFEFVTADRPQATLVRSQAKVRGIALSVSELSA